MRLTDNELLRLTDKSSRDPGIVELYRGHDFLTAYAKHTDRRVAKDPHQAIGGNWEEYGRLQRDFLIAQGLRPADRLLDVGCGTGRLARMIVPYLDAGNYVGVDISTEAIAHAKRLSATEGWASKDPRFIGEKLDDLEDNFDFAWAFSVFIHLPSAIIESMMDAVRRRLSSRGTFLFSYVPTDQPDNTRTGLKQFKHPLSLYQKVARDLGCSLAQVEWPGRQRILAMEIL